ncbi:uncharacterized protein [Argopecten irradians]|uniref:uncharacterized protein n=1 Tax=Argopecten irradians TaxID=31199 RepID=UPI003710BF86
MSIPRGDCRTPFKLTNKGKPSTGYTLTELTVNSPTYNTPDEIMEGWKCHFQQLNHHAPKLDAETARNLELEIDFIKANSMERSANSMERSVVLDEPVTPTQVDKSISKLNSWKSTDIYRTAAEHLKYRGWKLRKTPVTVFNILISEGKVPDMLKTGHLLPIFKKKGSKMDAKNYRGITVLPIILKVLKSLLVERLGSL